MSGSVVDFLIVGQGLAGTALAFALRRRGASFLLVDTGHGEAASRVAAGLLNPVTGPRLRLAREAARFLDTARAFYRDAERELGASFFQAREILRIIRTPAEVERWKIRRNDPEYAPFLGDLQKPGCFFPEADDRAFGSCIIRRAAVVDTALFLERGRDYFLRNGLLVDGRLNGADLEFSSGGVSWNGIRVGMVVFCEGWKAGDNPWFRGLPFQHAKGEILTLRIPRPAPGLVINRGKWILPLGPDIVRAGSTFCWNPLDCDPTTAGRKQLEHAVRDILCISGATNVIAHEAGVRPCSHDQNPYAGRHPARGELAVLNGLGSKGALLAPLCAERLADYLLNNQPLDPLEDIQRVRGHLISG